MYTTWLGPTKHVALSVAPATRGANLWFHHDMILNRFIRQRYDTIFADIKNLTRYDFDLIQEYAIDMRRYPMHI